jgi:uncharacterized protein
MKDYELRFSDGMNVETRDEAGKSRMVLKGYAAKFDTLSSDLGGFREKISIGAFDDVLEDDVRAVFNHDANIVLGRTKAGTARIGVDDVGLFYEAFLPDTQAARDLYTSVERGDVDQSSFKFRIASDGDKWGEDENGTIVRTITRFGRLLDVSPVTYPAYPDATVATRSLNEWRESSTVVNHQDKELKLKLLELE